MEDVTRMEREKMNTGFRWRELKKRDHLDDPAIEYSTKMDIKERVSDGMALNNWAEDIGELRLL